MLDFTFSEGRKRAGNHKTFFLFMNLNMADRNSAPEDFACIWQSKQGGITQQGLKKCEFTFHRTFSWLSADV